jgi:hypothetical protein
MADVRTASGGSGGDGDRDRGQLILVTGLAVAVTLVALVLLLNTVIYTQNLATRGAGVEDGEAVAFRQEVVEGVGDVLDAENREEYDSEIQVMENVTAGISRFDALLSRYYAEHGTVADIEQSTVTPENVTNGSLIHQTNSSRDFSAAGNDEPVDWTLAEDAGAGNTDAAGVRNFTMTVSRENLTTADSPPAGFSVLLDGDSGNVWRMYVYDDVDEGITVAVKNGTEGSTTVVHSVSGPEATIDLTAGTINGSAHSELVWAKGIFAPYDVDFRSGDEATGTYSLTVATPDGEATNVRTDNLAGPGDEESPRWAYAVYAAEFEVHFQTTNLEFHTTLRVAPGEPE